MSVRQALIVLNGLAVVAIIAVITTRVLSLRRNPEPAPPPNKTPFLVDEDLEGRRLERVLGWSLLFTIVLALALPVYFLVEPGRQSGADEQFEERSVERGATLFANSESPAYDPTVSLLCADCHGVDGSGGSTQFTLEPDAEDCPEDITEEVAQERPECLPVQVTWAAPPLDIASLIYDRDEITEIITYGRAGTPMPAWGVASGEGVLNEQSVDDLVNYVMSIELSPERARNRATEELEAVREDADAAVAEAEEAVAEAEAALAEAEPADQDDATEALADAEATLALAIDRRDEVLEASDGELLFQLQCARCHTKGWSYYDPLDPETSALPGLEFDESGRLLQGGGAYGPNLTAGAEVRQFPGTAGIDEQTQFVAEGVAPNRPYGARGISTGRMPHFNRILTEEQIRAIIDYERNL